MKRIKDVYGKVSHYEHNGWEITSHGGYSMIRHFIASKNGLHHWAFTLRECVKFCDERDDGMNIEDLYLQPLYL